MKSSSISEIFKAYDIRGEVGKQLNETTSRDIARAFADWLPKQGVIAVGHDMRPDSAKLADAFMAGLQEQGYDVWDIGLVTSDMIYFAVGKWNLAGGAVITASHNASTDNGIKLYRDQVIAVGLDAGLDKIRDTVLEDSYKSKSSSPGKRTKKNITKDWVEHCLTFVGDLEPYNIAIDTGNGMAGEILPAVLPKLPLKVERMYFELDGTFPNHEANPHDPKNLQDLIRKVTQNKLDFGIAFDGDGDRAALVDDKGRIVPGTILITIASKLYLEKYTGSKIVHEVRTSRSTQEFIREWGGTPVRCKAGRVNIGTVMRREKAVFGGETTGHLFFKENYDADSGLIGALVVIQALSNSGLKLSQLVDRYQTYAMMSEINFKVTDKNLVLSRLKKAFSDGKQDELDGITVNYPDYWFNMRLSNTEPLIRLNAEAKNQNQLDSLVKKITKIVQS